MGLVDARRELRCRLEEAFREMGVLLIVFAPIDYLLASDTPPRGQTLLILSGLGALFLGAALIAEYRRLRAD